MRRLLAILLFALLVSTAAWCDTPPTNLLLNPDLAFHSFDGHRTGHANDHVSHSVAFWSAEAWGDVMVTRAANADPKVRPDFAVANLVSIAPGKKLWQFLPLTEAGLAHGESVSLHVYGYQSAPRALRATVRLLKLDSQDGEWSPATFGMEDKRTFPRHSRGELVDADVRSTEATGIGKVELAIDKVEVLGRFHTDRKSHSDDINTIGLRVEFENTGTTDPVWVYAPCLSRGPEAQARLPEGREMVSYYRYLPRTMQKLWKGEPLHIMVMGSSIDAGSANPTMYLYDEDPKSPTFKQPLAEGKFDGKRVGRPDLDGYVGLWKTYFDYATRLRLELMRKYDLPASKLLVNFMAIDGSCIGESHSGLADYCSLAIPPGEYTNGHQSGRTWQQLYPELFARPEGPRPDLVIFGSGANEKTDTPDEVAVFEGAIRWIQRHYPETEFVFCQFQNRGSYTPNTSDLMALSLRYQIPFLDYGKLGEELTRWCSPQALVPADGHPQAAVHYLWFTELEKAFESWDPIVPGQAQLQLPERLLPATYGWEGDMVTYTNPSPRIKNGSAFLLDDMAFNCWADAKEGDAVPYVDGVKQESRGNEPERDVRNSFFRYGRLRLGDRHVLELGGKAPRLTAVDAKQCPERRFVGVESPLWNRHGAKVQPFTSTWGAPYGSHEVVLRAGASVEISLVGTDVSIAYADVEKGGTLRVVVDGVERLVQPANVRFVSVDGHSELMENRKGILGLGYGWHTVRVEAVGGPVTVLGAFAYDSRPNRKFERRLNGVAAAGETVTFSLPFRARPFVIAQGGLRVAPEDVTATQVTFRGEGVGAYEVIGE